MFLIGLTNWYKLVIGTKLAQMEVLWIKCHLKDVDEILRCKEHEEWAC
jgi:hypothetical protein